MSGSCRASLCTWSLHRGQGGQGRKGTGQGACFCGLSQPPLFTQGGPYLVPSDRPAPLSLPLPLWFSLSLTPPPPHPPPSLVLSLFLALSLPHSSCLSVCLPPPLHPPFPFYKILYPPLPLSVAIPANFHHFTTTSSCFGFIPPPPPPPHSQLFPAPFPLLFHSLNLPPSTNSHPLHIPRPPSFSVSLYLSLLSSSSSPPPPPFFSSPFS